MKRAGTWAGAVVAVVLAGVAFELAGRWHTLPTCSGANGAMSCSSGPQPFHPTAASVSALAVLLLAAMVLLAAGRRR